MTKIASLTSEIFRIPLHNPFVTSQGMATEARGVAVSLICEDGLAFRGESVPVQYVTGETCETVIQTISQIASFLVGKDISDYKRVVALIGSTAPASPSARCGLEMAVLNAFASQSNTSLLQFFGGTLTSVETDVTIPIVENGLLLALAAWERGIRVFKMKVGSDIQADFARIEAVQYSLPEARFRIDANQAFSPSEAVDFISKLSTDGVHVELLEQPVLKSDFEGLNFVAKNSPVPVFADESVCTVEDAHKLISTTSVHGINCKINKNGIQGVMDIIAVAQAAGRKLMLGCMLETRFSTALSLALACGTGAFQFIDLDSPQLLNEIGNNPYYQQLGPRMILPVL